jgi:pimeloyl-ACP methyl ester carboxylesterase
MASSPLVLSRSVIRAAGHRRHRTRRGPEAAAPLLAPPVQPVAIPYENTTLPGYFYLAGDPGIPRPAVIMHTGFDGTAEEMHFQGAAAAADCGYHVLAFDGPGQGGALHRQGLVFRPDWENVAGAVLDYARTQPGVAGERVALWGLSMGGLLAPRAAAFEHRLAAVIAVDGVYDQDQTVRAAAGHVRVWSGGCAPAQTRNSMPSSPGRCRPARSCGRRWNRPSGHSACPPRGRPAPPSWTTTCATGSRRRSPAPR